MADKCTFKAHVYSNVDVTMKEPVVHYAVPDCQPGCRAAEMKLDADGRSVSRGDASATPLQAKISVNQLDLAKSGFIDPSSGFRGTVNFAGTVDSDVTSRSGRCDSGAFEAIAQKARPHNTIAMKYKTAYDWEASWPTHRRRSV